MFNRIYKMLIIGFIATTHICNMSFAEDTWIRKYDISNITNGSKLSIHQDPITNDFLLISLNEKDLYDVHIYRAGVESIAEIAKVQIENSTETHMNKAIITEVATGRYQTSWISGDYEREIAGALFDYLGTIEEEYSFYLGNLPRCLIPGFSRRSGNLVGLYCQSYGDFTDIKKAVKDMAGNQAASLGGSIYSFDLNELADSFSISEDNSTQANYQEIIEQYNQDLFEAKLRALTVDDLIVAKKVGCEKMLDGMFHDKYDMSMERADEFALSMGYDVGITDLKNECDNIELLLHENEINDSVGNPDYNKDLFKWMISLDNVLITNLFPVGNGDIVNVGVCAVDTNPLSKPFIIENTSAYISYVLSDGSLAWEKCLDYSDQNDIYIDVEKVEAGFVLSGLLNRTYFVESGVLVEEGKEFVISHFDFDGEIIWERIYEMDDLVGSSLATASSNDKVVVAGGITSPTKNKDVFLMIHDMQGNLLSENYFGSENLSEIPIDSIIIEEDGIVMAAIGQTNSSQAEDKKEAQQLFIFKTDADGNCSKCNFDF